MQSYIVNAALYIAVVADNTGNNVTMAEKLALVEALKHLFFLGCFIHVMDLLVEDIAKLKPFAGRNGRVVLVCLFFPRGLLGG